VTFFDKILHVEIKVLAAYEMFEDMGPTVHSIYFSIIESFHG